MPLELLEFTTAGILERYDPWFSLQRAELSSNLWPNVLFETGCRMSENAWNCTAACFDLEAGPQHLWNQTYATSTMTNCLNLPFIETALANGTMIDPQNLAQKYGIKANNGTNITSPNSYPVVSGCIEAFCRSLDLHEYSQSLCALRMEPRKADVCDQVKGGAYCYSGTIGFNVISAVSPARPDRVQTPS